MMARWGWQKRELNERGESRSQAFWEKPNIGKLARPTGIEPKTIEKENDGEAPEAVDVSKQKQGRD